ncbi:hypothetical protein KY345_03950 [Candidatus Woesearchaeota archaeon]|nr:hypothetical protein [Candidatus Woesearchaeota archaeon]
MAEEIDFFLLTIRKDDELFANIYKDEDTLKKAVKIYSEKYPVRIFTLTKTFGTSYDIAVAEKDNKLVACLGPKEDIPDNIKNITKCKKKEIDVSGFLAS